MSIDKESTKVCSKCGPVGHSDGECPKQEIGTMDREKDFLIPKEIEKTRDRLTAFFEAFYQNQGIFVDDDRKRKSNAVRMAEIALENSGNHFYTIENGGRVLGTAQLELEGVDGEKRAMLSSLTVVQEERGKKYDGKKLSERLTEVRIDKAKSGGCQRIDTSIFSRNPDRVRALAIKFNNGYVMYKFEPYSTDKNGKYEMGGFWLTKDIDGQGRELYETESKIVLDDLNSIEEHLKTGWVGVRIEGEEVIFRKTK